ncbi:MAG: SRPBCC domain-containing protein [Candidatus Woykebacteria bacterium]
MMDKNTLVIERIFDAPVESVWKYWTDSEMLKKWWGPKNFTAPVVNIDFRVGGKYLSCMRGAPAEGAPAQDFWSTGTYKEITPLKKIVATDSFADEKGSIVPSSHYGMEGFPMEMLVTFEFEEYPPDGGGKTKLTLTHVGIENIPDEAREGMDQGWNESFDKIERALQK